MAKKIHEEDIKLNIIIGNNEAQKKLRELEKNTQDLIKVENELKKSKSDTKKELDKLNSSYGVNSKVIEKLEKERDSLLNKYNLESVKLKEIEKQQGKTSQAYKEHSIATKNLLNESIRVENQWEKLIDKNQELAPKVDKLSSEYKSLSNRLNGVSADIQNNKNRMSALQETIGITSLSIQQLRSRASQLRYSLSRMTPDTAEWKKLNAELQETNARIRQLNTAGQQQQLTFGKAADWLNKYQAMIVGVAATVTGLTYSLQQWLDYSGKLADANSNVMKVTGFTQKQIDELNISLGKISTRTSRMELLGLAEQAGRLGKTSLKDVEGFVEVANRLKVALGDDLGESQIQDVGKLVTTYKVGAETGKEFEGAMEALGSSINEVSASGANQASFLVDYMNRMAGVAAQAKLSAADNLGYAATFDELGQSVEVTSTAMNKVLLDMFKNPGEYAKIAGISIKDFNKLLNEDSNAAMIKFLEGLNGNSAGLQTMVQKMEELDAGGTRGVASLSALANNLDILKARQDTANQSMQEATSLTNEYNIKNNNLAATLDKIKKTTAGWFSSDTLVSWLTTVVNVFAKLIGAVEDTDGSIKGWRNTILSTIKVIAIGIATVISYKAAVILTTLWTNNLKKSTLLLNSVQKGSVILTNLLRSSSLLLTAAYRFCTLNIRGAAAAMRLFNMTVMANPLGLLISLVALATTAFFAFSSSADEATESQDNLKESIDSLDKSVNESITKTKENITRLINVIKDENVSLESRKKAYQELIKIAPEFNGYLEDEKFNIEGLTRMYDVYVKKLYEVARAKAVQAKLEKAVKEQVDADFKLYETETSNSTLKDQNSITIGGTKIDVSSDTSKNEINKSNTNVKFALAAKKDADESVKKITNYINSDLIKTEKIIATAEAKMKALVTKYGKDKASKLQEYKELSVEKSTAELKKKSYTTVDEPMMDFSSNSSSSTKGNKPSRSSGKSDAEKAAEKAKAERDKYFEDLKKETEKNEEEILKIQQTYEDISLENIEDKYDRELEILKVGFQRKQSELEAQQIGDETFKILNEQKLKATKEGDTDLIARIDNMKEIYLQKNEEIDLLLLAETHKYSQEKLNIERSRELKSIDKLIESGNKKIEEQKRLQRSELATISSVDDAKEILKRSLNDKELKEIKTWQDAKAALEKQYEQETLDAQEEFLREQLSQLQAISEGSTGIDFNLLTPEQQENFKSKIEDLKAQIDELIIKKNELKGQGEDDKSGNKGKKGKKGKKGDDGNSKGSLNKYSTDIFGMSPDDWQTLFTNLESSKVGFEEIAAVIGVMQQMYAQYAQMVAANENRELQKFEDRTNRKKDALSKQLDQGYINQATYNAEVQKLEDAYNKKKAETEYKQAKREKQMNIVTSLMNTAGAITAALKNPGGPAGIVLASIVGAMGAIQTGMILKQPLPSKGFEDGYINIQREQDGKNFRAKKGGVAKTGLVSQPTHFLAGEQGQHFPEMIIDGPTWKGLSPDIKAALQNDIMRVKGFEDGSYGNIASTDNTEFIAFLKLNYELLSDLKTNGIDARVLADYRNSAAIEKGIERVRKFKNKTRK